MIQVTRVDNSGDRELYGSEYSWITKFTLVSAEIGSPDAEMVFIAHDAPSAATAHIHQI